MLMEIRKSEQGFSLIEILVAVLLFSILGLSLAYSLLMMYQTRGRNYHNSLASQLAIEGIEDFQSQDPSTLSSANNSTASVARDGVTFQKQVSITVNADSSRTITVDISCPGCKLGGNAAVTNNFPQWGSV